MMWMRHRQGRCFKRTSAILVLVLVLLGFLPNLAHASTYVGYGAANNGGGTVCPSNCEGNGGNPNVGQGETIQAPFAGTLVAAGIFTTVVAVPTQIVILTFPAGSTPASTNYSCGSLGTCAFINSGNTFTVQDVESLSGMTGNAFNTVNLAKPVTVANGQWVAIVFMAATNQPYIMNIGVGPGQSTTLDTLFTFGSTNPSIGSTANSAAGNLAAIVGGSFNPVGQSGTTVTVTQCYGNCGSPPITLAITNSTHTVNFNQSITLFYEFQSNINGFILNVTTSVAKSYTNGQGIVEAIYVVPTCPLGQSPFTAQCPGYLASGWNVVGNPGKGRISNGNYQIPIANGQWAGVSISGVFSPLDLNDTNTGVQVFQTQGGGCACPPPASISQASVFSTSFKMGLWAWIVGNVVTATPPTTPGLSGCAGLDCILTSATNSFCGVVTTACQTGSALFWVIILTIISISALVFFFNQTMPGVNIGRLGIGEMGILFFLGWIVIFTSFNLLSIYVLLLVFFVVAALSAKTVRGYAGI